MAAKTKAKGSKRGNTKRTKTLKGGAAIEKLDYKGHVPEIHTAKSKDMDSVQTLKGVKLIVDEHVNMTPKFATEYIESPAIEMERNVRENHVQRLFDQMRMGRFNWDVVQIVTAELKGKKYKINGQHTCWAAFYLGEESGYKSTRVLGRVRRMHYRVTDDKALSALYQTFDPAQGARSAGHVTAMSLQHLEGLASFGQEKLNRIGSATSVWLLESSRDRKRLDPAQIAVMVEKKIDVVHRAMDLWSYFKKFRPANKHCIFAAALATLDKRPVAAMEFWMPVLTGARCDGENDPRLRLRNLLMDAVLRSKSKDKVSYSEEELYRCCLYCWNKWRAGEELRVTPRVPDHRPAVRG